MNRKSCFFLLATLMLVSCEKDMSPFSGSISYDDAARLAVASLLTGGDSALVIFGRPEVMRRGDYPIEIYAQHYDTLRVVKDSWLFVARPRYQRYPASITLALVGLEDGSFTQRPLYGTMDLADFEILYPQFNQPLSREGAAAELLYLALPGEEKAAIFMRPALLRAGERIGLDGDSRQIVAASDSWFFLIDPFYIRYDWPRYCQYLLMDAATGLLTWEDGTHPPLDLAEMDTLHFQWRRVDRLLPNLNFTAGSRQKSCCNFSVYRENEDETAVLEIRGDTTTLTFVNDTLNYDLGTPAGDLEVRLLHYAYLPVHYFSPIQVKCNDYGSVGLPPQEWHPTGGRLRIVRSVTAADGYRLSFEFIEVRFQTPGVGEEVLLNYHKIEKAGFGFCPG